MKKTAVYPGSFDPVTRGHEDLMRRSLHFVERLVVGVATDGSKSPLFDVDTRVRLLREVANGEPRIEVHTFSGLLVDFARDLDAALVVRGLRAVSDFEYEFQMALMNRQLRRELETVFLVSAPDLTFLSSSLVREVASMGGDVSPFVHPAVNEALEAKFGS